MCTISMIADDWYRRRRATDHWPAFPPLQPFVPYEPPKPEEIAKLLDGLNQAKAPTREEFDALKAELESLKKLLVAAKQYDTETGQPDCEDADKIALFKKLAKMVGVDLESVFKPVGELESTVTPE